MQSTARKCKVLFGTGGKHMVRRFACLLNPVSKLNCAHIVWGLTVMFESVLLCKGHLEKSIMSSPFFSFFPLRNYIAHVWCS